MTATNTPTPELVERLRKEIPYNADGFRELRDLADEAAAAIAKLTAERDVAREQLQRQFDQTVRFQGYLVDEKSKVEAAEQRIMELESELENIKAVNVKHCNAVNKLVMDRGKWKDRSFSLSERVKVLEDRIVFLLDDIIDGLRSSNKLLSERVAVLENALDTANTALEDWLHKYAPDECKQERVEETKKRISDAGGTLAYLADVFATIRRALAVREAK